MKVTCRANNLSKESEAINLEEDNLSFVSNKVGKIGLSKVINIKKNKN